MTETCKFSKIAVAAFALAINSTLLTGCGRHQPEGQAQNEPAPIKVSTAKVESTSITSGIDITGTVQAELNAVLIAKATGKVLNVNVKEGDLVQKGQLLVQVESADLAAAARSASSNVANSTASIQEAEQALAMQRKSADAQIAQANAALTQAEAARAAAKAQLDLVLAGPRKQEVDQVKVAVQQAQSNVNLAQSDFNRTKYLVDEGALAKRELEVAQNQLDQAQAQLRTALQAQSMAMEGSREQEVRQAREALAQADASVKYAQAAVKAAKASAMQVGIRQANVSQAVTRRSMASAQLQSANVALSYSRVVAPFNGRIAARSVDPGSFASMGVPLLTVEGGEFELVASVPERAIKNVHLDDKVDVWLDALPGTKLAGTVAELTPQADDRAHAFTVKYRLGANPAVKSGMFGRTKVAQGTRKVTAIPISALLEREGLTQVFVVGDDGRARMRVVTIGAKDGDLAEVLSGLSPGERVVTSVSKLRLADGQRVN